MKSWIWILVVILIIAAIGVYFLLSGEGSSIGEFTGNIPSPPALPD